MQGNLIHKEQLAAMNMEVTATVVHKYIGTFHVVDS